MLSFLYLPEHLSEMMLPVLLISEVQSLRVALTWNSLKVYLSSILSNYKPSRDTGPASLQMWKHVISVWGMLDNQ